MMDKLLPGLIKATTLTFGLMLTANLFAAQTTQQQLDTLQATLKKQQHEIAQLKQHLKAHQPSKDSVTVSNKATKQPLLEEIPTTSDQDPALPQSVIHLGSKNAQLQIFGQVNFMLLNADDGELNRTFATTNNITNSRLNINSLLRPNNVDVTLGTKLQLGFPFSVSDEVSQKKPSGTTNNIDVRKAEFYIDSKRWGMLSLGQGESASDNASELDISGTGIVAYSGVEDIGGGLFFRTDAGSIASSPTVADYYNNLDGFGRGVRVRYDSPSLAGFKVATSYLEPGKQDISLWYARNFEAVKIAAAIAAGSTADFFSGPSLVRGHLYNGSFSALIPFGLSISGAAGTIDAKETARKNPNYYYIKLGYQKTWFQTGLTAISADYGRYAYMFSNTSKAKTIGLQAVQNIDAWKTAVYVGYRNFDPGTGFKDINIGILGAIYKF